MEEVIQYRRDLHRVAELSFHEFETNSYLKLWLQRLGLEAIECAGTGLIVHLGPSKDDAVMIRADMDGLPIKEENDLPFKSKNKGAMHACGHDAHMAIAMRTLEWVHKNKSSLKRPVKFVFQPAEEKGGGAEVMVREGAMQNPRVSEVYGLHIANRFPSGTLSVKEGPFSAYCDCFKINIQGKGGHAARPYLCVEPIRVAMRVIQASQEVLNREIYAMDSNVMTFTSIHSGNSYNVISDEAFMEGTLRCFSEAGRTKILKRLRESYQSIERELHCKIDFDFETGYPATMNDAKKVQIVRNAASRVKGLHTLLNESMGMGGEDVSYFLNEAPGCYFLLGCGGENCEFSPHHSPTFNFDESVLKLGVEVFQNIIQDRAF